MRETLILILATFLATSLFWADVKHEPKVITIEKVNPVKTDWDRLVEAIIWRESRGNDKAINPKTKASGCLQIMPIYVKDANRIIGSNKYTLNDRFDREKSIEMFNVVQGWYNPNKDLHLAIKIHNPRASWQYHKDIENKYNELINN